MGGGEEGSGAMIKQYSFCSADILRPNQIAERWWGTRQIATRLFGNKVNIGRQRCYLSLPWVFDIIYTTQESIVLVVSPLKAHKYLQKLTL